MILLGLCCLSSSVSIGAFFGGLIPGTEPNFINTYELESMKPTVENLIKYSKTTNPEPSGYKSDCEKIKPQLLKIRTDAADRADVFSLSGYKKGADIFREQFGDSTDGIEGCNEFLT